MNSFTDNFETTALGLYLKTDRSFVFFGNASADAEAIQKEFGHLHFQRIKQIHSDTIVEASNDIVEADAHFTESKNTALLIRSADCLPVLIYCNETGRVAAVHAGWKGVANQIILKTIERLKSTGSGASDFQIWIGPHILQKSFEVDLEVLRQLDLATYKLKRSDYAFEENNKYHVDLNRIAASQIYEATGKPTKINFLNFDTKTDLNYYSFRRDKEAAGRNISFIAALR